MIKKIITIISSPYGCCCLLTLLLIPAAISQSTKDQWLLQLKEELHQSSRYDAAKLVAIRQLYQAHPGDSAALYAHYLALYNAYSVFHYDSAYNYAQKMKLTAEAERSRSRYAYAVIKQNQVLLSSGMFKEVFDSLKRIDASTLDGQQKAEYYALLSRSYFDLADYNNEKFYAKEYAEQGMRYLDSAISRYSSQSFESLYYAGLKEIRNGNIWGATTFFRQLANDTTLSLHQQAIVNSTFSDIFIRKSQTDSAIILFSKAAIADIRSSTKETSAIFHLANLLFKEGDVENASLFIQKATSDAQTYGARQRMVQLSSILPLIEAERLAVLEKEKRNILRYAAIITLVFVFLVILAIIIIRQVRKLKTQQKEINLKNASLNHLVEEKEWLLKEIHHRVKNNLHTIGSLLESQSAYLEDDALRAVRDSQHRVHAMSLIHQKLYQPERNVTDIDMPVYLRELVSYLKESFETGSRIHFNLDFEPVHLNITLAVPLGLILNEAITNAVKYAFTPKEKGEITISIKKTGHNRYCFNVHDNGRGLPPGFDSDKVNSLGMRLMKGLSADIAADFQISNHHGTRVAIEFVSERSLEHLQHAGKLT